MARPVRYTCPNSKCRYECDATLCDSCESVIVWIDRDRRIARCSNSSCATEISYITCRRCGERFSL